MKPKEKQQNQEIQETELFRCSTFSIINTRASLKSFISRIPREKPKIKKKKLHELIEIQKKLDD